MQSGCRFPGPAAMESRRVQNYSKDNAAACVPHKIGAGQ